MAYAPAYGTQPFVDQLLRILARSADVAGPGTMETDADMNGTWQRNIRQRVTDLQKTHPASQVADARFALGADDGAYLRSNVLPLQTSDPECDSHSLVARAPPEIEAASRRGVLEALLADHTKRVDTIKADVSNVVDLLAWLLSINEIAEFVCAHLGEVVRGAHTAADKAALEASGDFKSGVRAAQGKDALKNDLKGNNSGAVVCLLLHVILALFDMPQKQVAQQLAKTLGSADSGVMSDLGRSLDRLAISAQFVEATKSADQIEVYTDPGASNRAMQTIDVEERRRASQRTESNAAVGFNAAITGKVDFGAVHFPVGYDSSIEFDHPTDATITNQRRKERLTQRLLWSVATGTSAENLVLPVSKGLDRKDDKLRALIDKKEKEKLVAESDVLAAEATIELLKRGLATLRNEEERDAFNDDLARAEGTLAWHVATKAAHDAYLELLQADDTLREQLAGFVAELSGRVFVAFAKVDPKQVRNPEESTPGKYIYRFGVKPTDDDPPTVDTGLTNWVAHLAKMLAYAGPLDKEGGEFDQLERLEARVGGVKLGATEEQKNLVRRVYDSVFGSGQQSEQPGDAMMLQMQKVETNVKRDDPTASLWEGKVVELWRVLYDAALARNTLLIAAATATTAAADAEGAANDFEKQIDAKRAVNAERIRAEKAAAAAAAAADVEQARSARLKSYCTPSVYFTDNDADKSAVDDGLIAGITQMREDSGFVVAAGPSAFEKKVERRAGISPFFTGPRTRPLVRTGADGVEPDWWSAKLWPSDPVDEPLRRLPSKVDDAYSVSSARPSAPSALMSNGSFEVVYALARGLCGERGPHHARPTKDDSGLRYNIATVKYVAPEPLGESRSDSKSGAAASVKADVENKLEVQRRTLFGSRMLALQPDFASAPLAPSNDAVAELPKHAMWAPVERLGTSSIVASDNRDARNVATSVVLEHLVDHFKRLANSPAVQEDRDVNDNTQYLLALAAAAFAKVQQLPSLCAILNKNSKDEYSLICPATVETASEVCSFFTRPVLRCPGLSNTVLYPCDAGLATYAFTLEGDRPDADVPVRDGAVLDNPEMTYGAVTDGDVRRVVSRTEATSFLRGFLLQNATSRPNEQVSSKDAAVVPLYVAASPGATGEEISDITKATIARGVDRSEVQPRGDVNVANLPAPGDPAIETDALEATLREALTRCVDLERYRAEVSAIAERLKEEGNGTPPPSGDDAARVRREAVWNDAMREACISGDRLYAFARQFAGTISEQVDSICLIDEGMLVRQQQDNRAARQRLVDRASQEHMSLVRSVFAAVLKESGLTLGIDTNGDIGELKVVSNSLRKQANDLATGGSSSEGYFANSVRLENLLATGTGEMTLNDLFQRLGDAGKALQEAALSSQSVGSTVGTSLDFLSAPRNSLLLRWKPESLAAMRQAYDLFQREMVNLHGPSYRNISAYELIEGCDDALCSSFAQFCAHCLVHSRLYSSSTAMYVAAWPAAANATQLKVSLRRLINLACGYLRATATPAFLSENGRANYFTCAGSRQGGFGLPMITGRNIVPPGGLWKQNFYG